MIKRLVPFLFGLALGVLLLLSAFPALAQQTPDTYFTGTVNGQTMYAMDAATIGKAAIPATCGTSQDPCDFSFKECRFWTGSQWTCTATISYRDGTPAPSITTIINPYVNYCTTAKPWFEPAIKGCSDKPPQKTCEAGKTGSGRWQAGTNDTSAATNGGCVAGCQVQMTGVQSCWGPSSGDCSTGQCSCIFSYKSTGQTCTAGDGSPGTVPDPQPPVPRKDVPPIKPPAGQPCPAGTVQAGVDSAGTPICMGTGTDPKNPPPPPPKTESEKTEQKPDGSTVTTKTEVTQNSDGSTTTKTTTVTKGPDGSTKTDVTMDTSKTPTGEKGKDESAKDNEKYDLCKQNPLLTICRNSSVNGKCEAISCEGDAIQCATLRAAAMMQCQQDADKKALEQMPAKTLGQQILDGADPMKGQIDAALKGREIDMSKQALDDSGFVGGGSCFPDKSINVLGKTITVSFARVCQDIQPLRAAIMACAFIVAYLIVSKSVLQG